MNPVSALATHVPHQGQPAPRLVRAAHEFEGQLMSELLKPLAVDGGSDGEDEDSGSSGALGDFASEALGQGLSRQGGFGIANQILNRLSGSVGVTGAVTSPEKVTGKMHFDTGMRPRR